jgi:hypothetical protein
MRNRWIGALLMITVMAVAMVLYAGESVDGVKRVQAAAETVVELADGADTLPRRWA